MEKSLGEGLGVDWGEVRREVLIVKDLLGRVVQDEHTILVTIIGAFDNSKVGPAEETDCLFY